MKTETKPSDLKTWDQIKDDNLKHSQSVQSLKNKDLYDYYFDAMWYHHRKPTVSEIIADKFN